MALGGGATAATAGSEERGFGQAVNDNGIMLEITNAMLQTDASMLHQVDVEVHEGRVLLAGRVDKPETRVTAVRLAWQQPNVVEVIDQIKVAESESLGEYAHDVWLAQELRNTLLIDSRVRSINYNVDCVAGTIYLMGVAQNQAALLLASFDRPEVLLDDYRRRLADIVQDLAGECDRAGAAESQTLAGRAAIVATVIAERHEFTGDRETYDDMANANLISVLDRRRGLPVALSIVYIHAARALGWFMEGLNFPGRFLVRLGAPDGRAVLDPFDGGRLRDAVALRELLKLGAGASAELAPEHFTAAGNRDILLRLQNNIKVRLVQSDQIEAAAGVLERMLLIAPKEPLLW